MDPAQFDTLARQLGTSVRRRGVLAAVLAALTAPLVGGPDAAAKHGKRKGRGNGKGRAHAKRKRHGAGKERGPARKQPTAHAQASGCCSGGNCAPGPGKKLSKCCYEGASLSGQNFKGTNLSGANFSGADLTQANFNGANVSKACFVDADITGATFAGANTGGAIYCRTQTDRGEDNSGCDQGTSCCATCDAAHPCAADEVCCDGRCIPGDCCDNGEQSTCANGEICCDHVCVAGDCCGNADCPNETCQRRRCQDHHCTYTPISGATGPGCQTVCCEDAAGDPVCCDPGIETCQPNGLCGCERDADCGDDQKCCAGTCVAKAICCEGNNAEGCASNLHCCVLDGNGVCRECCDTAQCPDETCQSKSCDANHTCQYTPQFGSTGTGCASVCCETVDQEPICCPGGITVCTASRRCRCDGPADCTADQICCNGSCIANTLCCDGDSSTCPAPGVCHVRACASGACQPQGVTGGTCPFASGGTGECNAGSCVCPSPRITCSDGCCAAGPTACEADGTCPPGCDVCPSGCPFTTLAAAVAGTPDGGTIRICPGTYATNNVTINKNLTIIGAGSGSDPTTDTILTGGNMSQVLAIVLATVTIQDLTVTNGKATDECGGIDVAFNATLNLERVEVVSNTSDVTSTGPNSGGGLFVGAGSTAVVKASHIASNTTQGGGSAVGGGIFNGGTLTLETTVVELNSARGGGGIYNSTNAKLTLNTGVAITKNTATQPIGMLGPLGSGIYNRGTITDNDPTHTNVFDNNPTSNQCVNEAPGTGCPA